MDSDSSENTSSDYTTTDSSDDDGSMETAEILGTKLQIPQGICDRMELFKEVFSTNTWNSLSEKNRQHLQNFLPDFPKNDAEEKNTTLQNLFDFKVFRFNDNPLQVFHDNLKAGYYRPDIANMRRIIRKTQVQESRMRYKMLREKLKYEVLESRKKLLYQVRHLPPGIEPKLERTSSTNANCISHRTKKKYFQVLSSIRSKTEDIGFSSDENYPEGPPPHLSRKQKRLLNSLRNNLVSSDKLVVSTTTVKSNGLDLEEYVTNSYNPFYVTDDAYRNLMSQHKRRKVEYSKSSDLITNGITVSDVINRTRLPYLKNLPTIAPVKHHSDHKINSNSKKKIKREHSESVKLSNFFGHSSNSEAESDSDSFIDAVSLNNTIKNKVKVEKINKPPPMVKPSLQPVPPVKIKTEVKKEIQETIPPIVPIESTTTSSNNLIKPISNIAQYGKIAPVTLSDLEGIDMMNIPIDLDNSNIDILELNNKPELMQQTHSNFLSLIRDIICSTNEHRMSLNTLEDRLKSWQENPISPLNDWYSLSDNWVALLTSAVNFLCGNSTEQPDDFVPYMEYKPQVDLYQWIGAGRDSDALLIPLCQYWIDHRSESKIQIKDEIDIEVSDRSQTPPPPRCPTSWTVRKATQDEVKEFRDQERRRYDNPHKAFTYRCNGYESVVGPLKGIYNAAVGNTKARGHNMLSADRPNFVTILSLVRDATARLPNGEGTRADICELLKSSQYIANNAADNVLQSVVSGALDRMHTQFDPCVKYDPKKKIWIYLHRNRTEEDFERIHQQYQGMNKTTKKTASKKTPTKVKQKIDKTVKVIKNEVVQTVPISEKLKALKNKSLPQTTIVNNISSVQSIVTSAGPSVARSSSVLIGSTITPSTETSQSIDIMSSQVVPSLKTNQEEKEINEAIQAIVQNRVSSPVSKQIPKGLVKIISPSQGKSLIIPANSQQLSKQDKNRVTQQAVSQQLLQTIAAQAQQQKQTIQIIHKQSDDKSTEQKIKVPVTIQQQIIQSIAPQQLQNIKNVTLLRSVSQTIPNSNVPVTAITTLASPMTTDIVKQNTSETLTKHEPVQSNIQIKTQLTPAQQQQILQTIKQKILPQTTILTPQQQQIILKQKTFSQLQKHNQAAPGTSLLGQPKLTSEISKGSIPATQSPVVAKVLTNAAGQVISVESLLAHQKQHGTLPQGTTLRVSGTKGGQANIIQLTGTSKQNIAQFAVASQNNLIAITTQPKLVVATQTTTVTSTTVTTTKPTSRTVTKSQTLTKFPPKVAQQLINAKIITQGLDGQQKIIMGQPNQVKLASGKNVSISKPMTLNMAATTNTIRMVNAANLNLTQIGGKPVLLAGKGNTLQNLQSQNVILQAQPNSAGQLVLQQNTAKSISTTNTTGINIINQSNVVLAPQVKVQQSPQVVFTSAVKGSSANVVNSASITQGHLVLGSHPVRLQTSTAANTQRVVLASQGQGGQIVAQQILLPAGFQGTTINIKALQGVKVIPIAQAHGHGRGVQGRQVFARVMSPLKTVPTTSNTSEKIETTSTND